MAWPRSRASRTCSQAQRRLLAARLRERPQRAWGALRCARPAPLYELAGEHLEARWAACSSSSTTGCRERLRARGVRCVLQMSAMSEPGSAASHWPGRVAKPADRDRGRSDGLHLSKAGQPIAGNRIKAQHPRQPRRPAHARTHDHAQRAQLPLVLPDLGPPQHWSIGSPARLRSCPHPAAAALRCCP